MVRGNWQKRVERTEKRRVANKLLKEQRRAKRLSSNNNDDKAQRATWYRLLSEWLDDTDFFPSDDDPGDDSEKGGAGQYNLIVDIWTDARPKNRQEYLPSKNLKSSHGVNSDDDFEEEDGRGGKGRSKLKTKDRGGFKKSKGKKKAHPNTKQKTEEEDVVRIRRESRSNSMSVKDDDKLCAKEFFFGKEKCPAGKHRQKGGKRGNHDANTGGCSLQHYHQFPKVKSKIRQSPPLTLAQVVNGKYQPRSNNNNDGKHPTTLPSKVREACLQYAYDAMLGTDDNGGEDAAGSSIEANTGIENIYHTRIYVTDDASKDQEDNEGDENDGRPDQRSAVVDALEQLLDREKLSQTSLMYLTIQGVLVYDLNRGGLVFSEAEEDFLVSGEDIDVDAFLQYNAVDTVQSTGPSHIHEELNHHVLYDILSFLPDEAAAVLPQVCKSWRDEVGTKSPQLWKMLLSRHNWPFSVGNDDQVTTGVKTDAADFNAYKDAFISHYVAVRDIRAIASATGLLCGESNDFNTVDKSGLEYAMQRYKSTKGAPVFNDEENLPAQVKIWSESVYAEKVGARALVAYTHDCTLRLFEVVPRNNSPGSQNSSTARSTKCRQIACVKAVPPSVSQRRAGTYALGGIGLDEDVVACLFSCAPENLEQIPIDPPAHFLSIISRDDLACAGNEGHIDDDSLREFDIRAMILDFLLCGSADHVDHLQTALHEYLSFGQHGDTSHITVEVSPSLVSCGQGFFLFLAFIDIPVGSNDDTDDSDDDGSSRNSQSRVGHRVFLFSIKKGRIVESLRFPGLGGDFYLHASNPVQNHFITGNASSVRKLCTNVVIKSFDSADEWLIFSVHIAKNGTVDMQMKTLIDGHQIEPVQTVDPMPVVVMSSCAIFAAKCGCLVFLHDKENEESLLKVVHRINVGGSSTEIYDIFGIREEYVAVVLGTSQGRGGDEDAVAGEWFGLDEEQSPRREVAVFHVSSRQELFRCQLPYTYPLMFHMDCIGGTIAANVAKLGFVIAGGNAREVAMTALNDEVDTNQTPSKTTKTKKKRLASLASGRKKDGFARGMRIM